jgi:hypothetical protein
MRIESVCVEACSGRSGHPNRKGVPAHRASRHAWIEVDIVIYNLTDTTVSYLQPCDGGTRMIRATSPYLLV